MAEIQSHKKFQPVHFVEANPLYDEVTTDIFNRIAQGELIGATSVITLTEILIHPLQRNAVDLHRQYRDLLLDSKNFETLPITAESAEQGAILRAKYNLRVPDALQLAVAIVAECQFFLTNDKQLTKVSEIEVLLLQNLKVKR